MCMLCAFVFLMLELCVVCLELCHERELKRLGSLPRRQWIPVDGHSYAYCNAPLAPVYAEYQTLLGYSSTVERSIHSFCAVMSKH
jgi:hypothetical protein